jgi:hypothetical protein
MKRISKAVLKGLLVVILFTGGSIAVSTTGVKTVSEANAATYNQVYEYLLTRGYTVITLAPKSGTEFDWLATTVKNGVQYYTTVYCTASSVVGNSDVPCFR